MGGEPDRTGAGVRWERRDAHGNGNLKNEIRKVMKRRGWKKGRWIWRMGKLRERWLKRGGIR
jgi:hypothetical protein